MVLLKRYLRLELKTLIASRHPFQVIGRHGELAPTFVTSDWPPSERTAANTGMRFNIALNYGGRAEIVDAVRRALAEGIRPDELDEARFGELLYTAGQPDPDLLIRTSGEMRVSNFLLWQIAYAEIWVTDTLLARLPLGHLLDAILAYQKRDRRYGGIKPAVALGVKWRSLSMTRLASGLVLAVFVLAARLVAAHVLATGRGRGRRWCWPSWSTQESLSGSASGSPRPSSGTAACATCAAFGHAGAIEIVLIAAMVALGRSRSAAGRTERPPCTRWPRAPSP